MVRRAAIILLLLMLLLLVGSLLLPARADTIVLKNGRRIPAGNVVEEDGRVSYETRAGRLSLPRSIVERIERNGSLPAEAPLDIFVAPPQPVPGPGTEDVARATVRDAGIDREYLARLEEAARSGAPSTIAKLDAAHHAAAQFELRRGDLEEAKAHYRRALSYSPQPANLEFSLLLNLAYAHLRGSEYSAALDPLERARRIAPDSPDVAKLAGWAYYGLNRIDRTIEEWKRALRSRPDPEVERALEKAERDLQEESNYREGETQHFTLRYHGGAAPGLARAILRTLEGHFRTLESAFNYTPPEPIGVILYTEQAFADITRAPGWVGAFNDGRIRVPVQGLTSVTPELSAVLKHELTHSFIQQKTRGRCPVWLQEGLAQWMEGSRAGEAAGMLVATHARGAALPLEFLEGSWMRMDTAMATYSYAWSLAVVESVVETYGLNDLVRVLDRLPVADSTEAAFRETLRMDYSELEKGTLDYLRRAYLK